MMNEATPAPMFPPPLTMLPEKVATAPISGTSPPAIPVQAAGGPQAAAPVASAVPAKPRKPEVTLRCGICTSRTLTLDLTDTSFDMKKDSQLELWRVVPHELPKHGWAVVGRPGKHRTLICETCVSGDLVNEPAMLPRGYIGILTDVVQQSRKISLIDPRLSIYHLEELMRGLRESVKKEQELPIMQAVAALALSHLHDFANE